MPGRLGWATTGNPKSMPAMRRHRRPRAAAVVAACRCRRGAGGRGARGRRHRGPPCARTGRTRASGSSGMKPATMPRLLACHVAPPSSLRYTPAAEMAIRSRSGSLGWTSTVWRQRPPPPGSHCGRWGWSQSASHEREGAAAVVAAEQRRRLDAGVEDVGLVGGARRQLPDASQGGVAAGGEGERGPLVLGPGGSEVVGAPQDGTPVVADRADEQPGARAAGVDARRVHLLAGERRSGQLEVVASARRGEREEALGGPDEHQRVHG